MTRGARSDSAGAAVRLLCGLWLWAGVAAAQAQPVAGEAAPAAAPASVELEAPAAPRDSLFDAGRGALGDVTVGIGAAVDALDPRAAAGAELRLPQFMFDGRFGLGRGWSALAHVSTILAINEFLVGASYSFPVVGPLRAVAQFRTGVFFGMLGQFGFDSTLVAPQFRPLFGLSVPMDSMRWSLRGEVVFSGPYHASMGDVSANFATPPPVANWNLALTLENLMQNNRLWYVGLALMGSTASYQNWLLFPDTRRYDYYPRLTGGYEF